VLCGRDLRSAGTWIGVHTTTGISSALLHHPVGSVAILTREVLWAMAGDFAGLTNIGGRGGPGGISRGKLVLDFILDPSLDLPDNM
jgi:uncharacterized protein with NRDE domain